MVDVVSPEKRSQMMSGIRGKNTKPELTLRRHLHAAGLRFRLHDPDVTGRPDLVFVETGSRVCPRLLLAPPRGLPLVHHTSIESRVLGRKVRTQHRPGPGSSQCLELIRLAGGHCLGMRPALPMARADAGRGHLLDQEGTENFESTLVRPRSMNQEIWYISWVQNEILPRICTMTCTKPG